MPIAVHLGSCRGLPHVKCLVEGREIVSKMARLTCDMWQVKGAGGQTLNDLIFVGIKCVDIIRHGEAMVSTGTKMKHVEDILLWKTRQGGLGGGGGST
jgi:hypothetical protein